MKFTISKSYIVFGLVLSAMALFVGMSMMKLFTAFRLADEIDNKLLESVAPRLKQDKLNEAIVKVEEKKIVLLDADK